MNATTRSGRTSSTREQAIVAAYRRGDLVTDISAAFEVDQRTVYAVLYRHSVTLRTKGRPSRAQVDAAVAASTEGTVADIARIMGRTRGTVLRSLAEYYGTIPDGASPDDVDRWRQMRRNGMSVALIASTERRAQSIVAAALIAVGGIERRGGAGTGDYT